MIHVTRINGQNMIINGELIELIESKPDTIVSLTTGRKYIIQDTVNELLQKLLNYKRSLNGEPLVEIENEESYALSEAI